jgi:hypothetical protein
MEVSMRVSRHGLRFAALKEARRLNLRDVEAFAKKVNDLTPKASSLTFVEFHTEKVGEGNIIWTVEVSPDTTVVGWA